MASSLPWHRRFSSNVEQETYALSAEEFGVLTRIVDRLQIAGHPLLDNDRYLSGIAGVGNRAWKRIRERLVGDNHLIAVEYKGRASITCESLNTELAWRDERSESARKSARAPRRSTVSDQKMERNQSSHKNDRSTDASQKREHQRREQPGHAGCSSTRLDELVKLVSHALGSDFARSYIAPGAIERDRFVPRTLAAYDKVRRERRAVELLSNEGLELAPPSR